MNCCDALSVPYCRTSSFSFSNGSHRLPSNVRCEALRFDVNLSRISVCHQRDTRNCQPGTKLNAVHRQSQGKYGGFGSQSFRNASSRIRSNTGEQQAVDTSGEEKVKSEAVEKLGEDPLPTMEEIQEAAKELGLKVEVRILGPWFQINLMSADETVTMGSAEGFETWWTEGKILHLEAVRLTKEAPKGGSLIGPGFLLGAACVRYGLDKNCPKAELLAINDDDEIHAKLVKYYSRLGFKALYELKGEGWTELFDRVVWGGVGTRMDANCEELLRKWAKYLRPKSKRVRLNASKGFSSSSVPEKVQQ